MTELKNIYDVLKEMDFENKCEKYALGFHRDTDTPTMTKFRQESVKQFAFSLIQEFYERALGELADTKNKLDIAMEELTKIKTAAESVGVGFFMTAAISALAKIKNAEQINEIKGGK